MAENTSINAEQIIVIDKNGNLKLIAPGEKVLPGEIIVEGSSGSLVVSNIDLPEKNDDINAILSAIVDGQDPSLIADAPAAGEDNGSSLTTSTEIERIGKSTIAETSFDTSSLESLGLSKTQSLTLSEQYKAYRETGEFQIPDPSNGLVKTAPTLSIQEVDENGVINEKHAENDIQVEVTLPIGTEKGDKVELHDGDGKVVGEHLITEDDITNGKVEITVPTPTPDGSYEYVADITDPTGDTGPRSNEVGFELDTTAPGKGVDDDDASNDLNNIQFVDGDGVLNGTELSAVTLTGKVEANGTLNSIVISGKNIDGETVTYTLKAGEYSVTDGVVTITGLDLKAQGFADGDLTVDMSVTDEAGNSGVVSDEIQVDITGPESGIDFVDGGDELLNAQEAQSVTFVSKVEAGSTVNSVLITDKDGNEHKITSGITVSAEGVVTITAQNLSGLNDGTLTVSMEAEDSSGNTVTVTDTTMLDTTAPGKGVDDDDASNDLNNIQFVDGDGVLNGTELSAVTLTGKVEANGTLNRIVISGKNIDGETVTYTLKAGEYSVTDGVVTITGLDLKAQGFADGDLTVDMSVTDEAGNSGVVSDEIQVDITGPESGIDFVDGGDELLNAQEAQSVTFVSKVEAGSTVNSVLITDKDGNEHKISSGITVSAEGVVTITAQNLSGLNDGTLTVSMEAEDSSGNTVTVTDTTVLDTTADNDGDGVTVAITGITEDTGTAGDYVTTDNTLKISGTVDVDDNNTLSVKVGDNTYTVGDGKLSVSVSGGVWTLDLEGSELADGVHRVMASVTDANGNTTNATQDVTVDTTYGEETGDPVNGITPASVSITDNNDADGNNSEVINATEKADITVRFGEGVSSGTATVVISDEDGDTANDITFNVTLNGDGTATVDGDYTVINNNDGTYTINDVDVKRLADGTLTANATFIDQDGNTAGDSDSASDTAISDTVAKDINNAPTVNDLVFNSTDEDVAISLNLKDLKIRDDVTLTNITVDPAFGSLDLIFNDVEVTGATFTPAENKHFDSNNAVKFEVTVTDGYQSSTGSATLIVNAAADKPTLSVVLGESVIAGPGFDTSDVNSIKDFFANGGTIPGIGNVVYSGEMVLGDDGNNLIIGTGVVNSLIGDLVAGTGNDVFVGGSSNDSIYGGTGPLDSGIDGVIYSGKISEYLIVNQGGAHGGGVDHWVVTDTLGRDTGYDHTRPEDNGDHLYQIERLIFSDAIVELNSDGTYTILQETETTLDLSASVMDTDGSEYLDTINISGLPAGAQIFDKDSNQPLGEFKEINGEKIWVIDIAGQDTQTVNYDNLVVRYPSAETLDIDVSAVAKESSNNSEATTTVNAAPSQDIHADIILGHEGNDILIGGLGDDILVGGAGKDIFKWVDQGAGTGTDTIKDFTVGEDLIDLTEIIGGDDDAINMEDLLSHITVSESGDDLTLSITDDAGNAHEIIVEGAVDSFGLEDANFSNQSEVLTKLMNDQMFKLDDIT
ncbi:Ig-like domain-containing protein [Aliivibrio finisterrensis]|uniref:Bacterial Ig-like domain-containing protein n=1 Tax=Aliivibrio finisterrensis TaxID=511998 RepID=A0A6N6RWH8_9GAMM|nr:Ig-like domain-containing protein [Aliivibrio finisterrensis]KAB2826117.1 hypothetical protein F8B77_02580 [Aliivibrio finisterrensis]